MSPEQELQQFEDNWNRAIVSNDINKISGFMSDDWVMVGSDNGIIEKPAFLQSIESGDLTHSRMDYEEIRVKVYGDAGITTNRGTSAGHYKGQYFELYEWSSSTFIRKNQKWFCVLTMLTPANKR